MVHSLESGAKRVVDGVNDPNMKSGKFYASRADGLTGPMVDQSEIFPDLANASYQDNASDAVHRFI